MSTANQVFITGLGALTACGATANITWEAILAGRSGLAEISQWDLSTWPARLGGELKDMQAAKMLPDRKLLKVISRQDVLGIHVATEAIAHSGMIDFRDALASPEPFNNETALFVGSPGNKYLQQYDFLPLLAKTDGDMQSFAKHLFDEVHPMWLLRILPNNVLAYVGITYGFKGPNHNITNHAVSGTQAILEAYHAIASGQAKRAVVVAYDIIEPQALYYYDKLGVLSKKHLKPFDSQHDGTILAEGAAALVLESQASVEERGAKCYAEIRGGFSASEAAGLFSLEHEGAPLQGLIQKTLRHLTLAPEDIQLIVAHGNGNQKSDNTEAMALSQVFAEKMPPVTAFKWAMGHTLTASGIMDAVFTTYALQKQCIPGIAPLTQLAATCSGLNVSKSERQVTKGGHALVINRGFASMNACLVMKSCDNE